MKKKFGIFKFLVLIGIGLLIGLIIICKDGLKTEVVDRIPILKISKVESHSSPLILKHENAENEQNSAENKLAENKILRESKNEPANVEQAEEEKLFWLEKIKRENAIERLNKNNLSEKERQEYEEIYKRLSQLDSFIYKNKMDSLAAKVAEVEEQHDKRLKELGISKQN